MTAIDHRVPLAVGQKRLLRRGTVGTDTGSQRSEIDTAGERQMHYWKRCHWMVAYGGEEVYKAYFAADEPQQAVRIG